jgi:hypothetical protein
MNAAEVLASLRDGGVSLTIHDGRLGGAPPVRLTDKLRCTGPTK